MYDELVKALRGCVLSKPCDGCPYYDPNGPTEKCATMNIAAANAIEELSKPHWIPVAEKLPETNDFTLILTRNGHPGVCYFVNGWWGGYSEDHVTHWMPLPQPAEEGE